MLGSCSRTKEPTTQQRFCDTTRSDLQCCNIFPSHHSRTAGDVSISPFAKRTTPCFEHRCNPSCVQFQPHSTSVHNEEANTQPATSTHLSHTHLSTSLLQLQLQLHAIPSHPIPFRPSLCPSVDPFHQHRTPRRAESEGAATTTTKMKPLLLFLSRSFEEFVR